MKFLWIIVLIQWINFNVSASVISSINCLRICSMHDLVKYAPVCGINKNKATKFFGNQCQLQVQACTDSVSEWKFLNNGTCPVAVAEPECNQFCTLQYDPVCGTYRNGTTVNYGNECQYNVAKCLDKNLVSFSRGECCSAICPKVYSPVCGEDINGNKRTFNNKCDFTYVQCSNPILGWTHLADDKC